MTIQTQKYHDPLIDEVRQRRAELYAALGSDLRKHFQAIQELQQKHPEKVKKPTRRSSRVHNQTNGSDM